MKNSRKPKSQKTDPGGRKKVRGKSDLRPGEPSKRSCNLYLSEFAIKKLDKLAKQVKVSKSEFVELWIRSLPDSSSNDLQV